MSKHIRINKNNPRNGRPPVKDAAFPCVFTEEVGYIDTTEAGNTLIKALNQLQEAAQSAEGRARWEAWQILQNEVASLRRGNVPLPLDLAAQPQLFIAAQAVSAWIDAFAPSYLPEGQKAVKAARNGGAA